MKPLLDLMTVEDDHSCYSAETAAQAFDVGKNVVTAIKESSDGCRVTAISKSCMVRRF